MSQADEINAEIEVSRPLPRPNEGLQEWSLRLISELQGRFTNIAAVLRSHLLFDERTTTPADPLDGTQARTYFKDNKIIFQYNDAGTVRYKYLDLTGVGVTWVHTTVAP